MQTLEKGDRFPDLAAPAVDGSTFYLPDELDGIRAVIVFYRGHW